MSLLLTYFYNGFSYIQNKKAGTLLFVHHGMMSSSMDKVYILQLIQ